MPQKSTARAHHQKTNPVAGKKTKTPARYNPTFKTQRSTNKLLMSPPKLYPRRYTRSGTSRGQAYCYEMSQGRKPGYTRTARKSPRKPKKSPRQQIFNSQTSVDHPQDSGTHPRAFLPSPANRTLTPYYSTHGRPPNVQRTSVRNLYESLSHYSRH